MRMSVIPALLLLGLLAACDSGTDDREDVTATRVVMRPYVPVPPGSTPRGTAARAAAVASPGAEPDAELVAHGRERFLAFCSPCHGEGGYGDGPVTRHGFPPPPSYHQPRLREAAPVHFVAVITNGLGRMYSYADRVPPEDRWAIAHYIKALQGNPPPPPAGAPTVAPRQETAPGRIETAPAEGTP
jgi:mono/diheme cytochrome c family protein